MQNTMPDQPTIETSHTSQRTVAAVVDHAEIDRVLAQRSTKKELLFIVLTALIIASIANHLIAVSLGYGIGASYRRIGPTTGPQVFCVGSSVLYYSLGWPAISEQLGQGIEHTNVAGSSPEIWEVFQRVATNVNTTIVGISPYDLNEHRISREFATFVPLAQTIENLRGADDGWQYSGRLLSEYPMAYLRLLFPTAGDSQAVLVGMRRLARQRLRLASAGEDQARVLALPPPPLMDFGVDDGRLSDLPRDRVLRRLSLVRTENRGMHAFNGPKQVALRRILDRASRQGRVILVVLPVSRDYLELLTAKEMEEFENVVDQTARYISGATVIRLDRVSALQSDDKFIDFVHMHSDGRAIATKILLEQIQPRS